MTFNNSGSFNQSDNEVQLGDSSHMNRISTDSYVRMTHKSLLSLSLVHLLSGVDLDSLDVNVREGASFTNISGYTEWVSITTPLISIGWDWWLDTQQNGFVLRRIGAPRSNIMIVDSMQKDLDYTSVSMLLEDVIDNFNWNGRVLAHIAICCS
ncbi:DUF4902 domain-containing protein [Sulfuriferula nivalis]|uniref:DUF4902 domain-containing protein n=1 Tax=Sulfuriferula nivalis TaxID=2675298 RepID=A0A809S8V0_9PROT|nr:DUF4902 domain-containing protein [Sulfuriferula nivalis]BBP00472.1 hypothetical protein SFSGTM_11800 [Sulfuriferula nivalis]